ncbi:MULTISPECIES: hypothetical protein [Rhizobium]|uniref:hypothetical protein n=1 Tax=Rhizobium TaxID=379 RepID=UPI001031BC27|nr:MULTISPECIES: hypothetical protein [Rhizobium]TBD09782.1 hypothetical protein ELH23_32735 [Rhizobium ruizarguesonis]TBY49663.1 hypothetical protein E0H54_08215 [Rhizobium leguminosarum bv. viciae]
MYNETKRIIREALKQLAILGVNHRLHRYVLDKARDGWRDLEAELHAQYPVRGIGIRASRNNIKGDYFFFGHELLAPEEVTHLLSDTLFDAAMASYAFTILEIAGDDLVQFKKPESNDGKAWHLGITQEHKMTEGTAGGLKIRFAKIFDFVPDEVSPDVIIRLARIKAQRNEFAHQGRIHVDFQTFLADAMAILCHLFFLCHDDEEKLLLYPFETDHPRWGPDSDEWDMD